VTSLSSRVSSAYHAISVIPVIFSAYADPSTPTGWADVPSALVVADLIGRDDIEFTAMIDRSIICANDATLAVTRMVDGVRLRLLGIHFANVLSDLELAAVAGPNEVAAFAAAEVVLLTTVLRMLSSTTDQVVVLILVLNDRACWHDDRR
jgi:hypothetical protein